MKKFIYLFVALLVISACSKDETVEITETQTNLETNFRGPEGGQTTGVDVIQMEKTLQWIAFITATVIIENPSYAPSINSGLNGNNIISLENLIGDQSTYLGFKTAFLDEVESVLLTGNIQCPGGTDGTPPDPFLPNGRIANNNVLEPFLDYALEDNCFELYFPTGMNYGHTDSITSVAHPLSEASANEGFRRASNTGIGGFCPPIAIPVLQVKSSYVGGTQSWNHTIVARPFRPGGVVGAQNCIYSSIPVTNFTDYLAGPF